MVSYFSLPFVFVLQFSIQNLKDVKIRNFFIRFGFVDIFPAQKRNGIIGKDGFNY
jgi:hypothetical protein